MSHAADDARIDFGAWSSGGSCRRPVTLLLAGAARTRCWGLTTDQRIARLAARRNHPVARHMGTAPAVIVCNARYWFEAGLIDWCSERPGRAVLDRGHLVVGHVASREAETVGAAIDRDLPIRSEVREKLSEPAPGMYFAELAKREEPLVIRVDEVGCAEAERRSFRAAYRGITDILTKYVWPVPAFHLTRLMARFGITPNLVTAFGTACAILACLLWASGGFVPGLIAALTWSLGDTVDGKLARCTVRSSPVGDLFDHGVDVLFPPLAWTAWAIGAGFSTSAVALKTTLACYLVQRLIELAFVSATGMQIHHWRPFDARFKLVTAQRNTLIPLAAIALPVAGPAGALRVVAGWSLCCVLVHAARLAAALGARLSGESLSPHLSRSG